MAFPLFIAYGLPGALTPVGEPLDGSPHRVRLRLR
ncbi:hypothetical protein SAMN05421771_1157 [Granulicella pectinivorans]|uniref:Uncharacterized protein n=1 Tax=Granulicella pectinivorans TaxID=474950 RepID=A0A1I6LRD6_9BACT|nr:hypothetical protein SAMN05421771_1157 [Granulicella pectinivorans]